MYEALYVKRTDIVNGTVEVEAPKDEVPEADTAAEGEKEEDERDEAALKFIKDVKSSNLEDNDGFKLDFYFEENPYFKNTVLSKTYHMIDDDELLERAVGTEIEWAVGKNLTQKGSKNAKLVTKTEQCESFFNFFTPLQVPEDDDIDQDIAEALDDSIIQDYDIGLTIRDEIIPHAVSWFTGDALNGKNDDDDDWNDDCKQM